MEAHGRDPGGNAVGILLFVDDGYLSNLEVYGWDGSDFAGVPDPAELQITRWSEPDENGSSFMLNPESLAEPMDS